MNTLKGSGRVHKLIRDLKGDRDSGGVMTNTEIFKAPEVTVNQAMVPIPSQRSW